MRTRARPATQRSLTNVTRLRSCAAVTPCLTGDSRLLGDCAWRSNQVQDPYHQNDCQGDATQMDFGFHMFNHFRIFRHIICHMSVIFLQTEKLQDKNRSELTKIGLPLGGGFTTHVQGGVAMHCIGCILDVQWMCNGCLQRFTGINDQECSTGPGQKSQTTTRRQGHAGTTGQNEYRESDPNRPSVA